MHNTALGTSAQAALTSGNDNTAVGYQAQTGLTSGNDNVAVGSGAQAGATVTGDANIAIGSAAQSALTTGTANVAIGDHALNGITSGGYNMAVGPDALRLNSTGGQNAAVGEGALYNVTGSQNVGIGPSAGRSLTSGSTNTAIGYNAGKDDGTTATTATVSNTVMLGAQAQALASNVAVLGSTTNPMSLCLGNYGNQLGGGRGVIALSDAQTVPSSNPTGGGVLYSDGGALKWRGPSGAAVTLSAGSSGGASAPNTLDAFNPPSGSGLSALVGNGSTDDSAALQAALNYANTTWGGGRVIVSKPGATVKCSSGVTVPTTVQLVSDRKTLLNFPSLTGTQTAITVSGNAYTPLVDVWAEGPNSSASLSNTTIGVKVDGGTRLHLKGLTLKHFGRGLDVAHSDTYIITVWDSHLSTNGTSLYADYTAASATNAGENISLIGCLIDNSALGINATSNGCSMFFTNCSIDFCTTFGNISDAWVHFTSCHLETGGNVGAYLFGVDRNSHVKFTGTKIIMGGGRTGGLYALFDVSQGPWNYGYGRAQFSDSNIFFVDPNSANQERFSDDLMVLASGSTTLTFYTPYPLRWCMVDVGFVATDGVVVPNADTITITSMNPATGQVTLTASASYGSDRFVRVKYC
jgi:hypothetical protein